PASARFRALLRTHLDERHGLIVVTHNLAEVWELASRVAVLVGGRWVLEEPRGPSLEAFLPRYHELIGG
ncbi:MAG TPA: hypothetical protein VFL95_00755, partial [Gemmatimonadales bacterium]|nr:hypothetical protein [Gemmatimonadales bacterium]